jgi:hypothetical protein
MDVIKGVTPVLVGVAVGVAAAWLMLQRSTTDDGAEFATHLADLDRRLTRLERTIGNAAVASPTSTARELTDLQEAMSWLQEQVGSLTHASASPDAFTSPRSGMRLPRQDEFGRMEAEPRSQIMSLDTRSLEQVVTEVVSSLTPRYLEEQVSQLYTAQKQADEQAQREAEQHRREEAQARRLTQLVSDLQTFVPYLTAVQVDEVAQVIQDQWHTMGTMRQQAWEQGTMISRGQILQSARELTDEKLYAILSPSQVEAFRLWRETRFGVTESAIRE